jgi:hypothetical protein
MPYAACGATCRGIMAQMPEVGLIWLAKAGSAEIIISKLRLSAELKKAPQSNGEPDVYPCIRATARAPLAQSRSKIAAIPWPPPMHIVTSA